MESGVWSGYIEHGVHIVQLIEYSTTQMGLEQLLIEAAVSLNHLTWEAMLVLVSMCVLDTVFLFRRML